MKGGDQMKTVMNKLLPILPFLFLLSSCASLNPLDVLNPNKPSLEVNAQVGKTNEQEKNNIKLESGKQDIKQEAEKITNDNNYTADKIENITQGMSIVELLLFTFLAGWAIPTPAETFRFAKRAVSDTVNMLIVMPVKGFADFILKVIGRK